MRHRIVGRHHGNQVRERLTARTEVATSCDGSEKLFAVAFRGQKTGGYVVETYELGAFSGERALGRFPSDNAAKSTFLGVEQKTPSSVDDVLEDASPSQEPAFLQVSATVPQTPLVKGKSGKARSASQTLPRMVKVKTTPPQRIEGGGRRALAGMAASLTTRQ